MKFYREVNWKKFYSLRSNRECDTKIKNCDKYQRKLLFSRIKIISGKMVYK